MKDENFCASDCYFEVHFKAKFQHFVDFVYFLQLFTLIFTCVLIPFVRGYSICKVISFSFEMYI